MSDTPLGQARQALLDARANAERNPSGANLKALEDARVAMDALLDETPHPDPGTPEAHRPGVPVSLLSHEAYRELYSQEGECPPGDSGSGGEQ